MLRDEDDGHHYSIVANHRGRREADDGTKLLVDGHYDEDVTGLDIGNSTILKTVEIEFDTAGLALDDLLRGVARNRSIELFNLYKDEYETESDADLSLLAPFFEHNRHLRFLLLGGVSCKIMKTLISVLPKCMNGRLQYIGIDMTFLREEDSKAFFDSLDGISSLLEVTFKDNDIGKIAGTATANLLKSPKCAIENLSLGSSEEFPSRWLQAFNVDDEGVACLGDALSVNKSLKHLDLAWNESITLEGWEGFASSLSTPNNTLQTIVLSKCNIDDEGASVILSALAEKTSIQMLDMSENSITSTGLMSIFNVLLHCKTKLGKLVLNENQIRVEKLTDTEWSVLSSALCDTSSINNTHSSNHNFHTLELNYGNQEGFPEDIVTCLQMNKHANKSEVAHQKILKHHFSGGDAGMDVTGMPENLLPYVFEWMGRSKNGYSAMHNLVRGMPTLFDMNNSCHAGMKRKR